MSEKAESTLEINALKKFTFPLNEKNEKIEWEEKGKEFRFNDEMYDIVKVKIHKDSITYYCLHDMEEGTLIHNFDKLVKSNLGNNGKSKNVKVKDLSKYDFRPLSEIYLPDKKIQYNSLGYIFYVSITVETQSPPPKTILYTSAVS